MSLPKSGDETSRLDVVGRELGFDRGPSLTDRWKSLGYLMESYGRQEFSLSKLGGGRARSLSA